jgi:hypothetical protein
MPERRLRRVGHRENESPPISVKERQELRTVIKARVKALNVGIEERRADQLAEVERQINARYAEQKAAFNEIHARARELVAQFNQEIIAPLYAPLVGEHREWGGFAGLETCSPPDLERQLMRKRANLEIEAATKAAQSRLVRWEADALEAVARTGIVSSEAQALLDQMASIDILMPTVALPSTAENVVTEMVTAEGKMPWVSQRNREDYWELDDHATRWRRSNALPALPSAEDKYVSRLEAHVARLRALTRDITEDS